MSKKAIVDFIPAAASGPTGWASLIPQSGLVNCWPFDTKYTTTSLATDVIGGNDATLADCTLYGSGPSTNLDNAAVFNGTTSRGTTSLAGLPTTAFSLVFWSKDSVRSTERILSNDHVDVTNNGFQVRGGYSGFGDYFLDLGNGSSYSTVHQQVFGSAGWNMICFTYSGTTVTPYINAVAGTTGSFTGPIAAAAVTFTFGPSYTFTDFYTGELCGCAIYNRAITSGEVTTIYGL